MLVAIILAVAVRMCFFKRQEQEIANIKQNNPEPALDRQAHGRDFDDVFAGTKGATAKVNMAEDIIPGGRSISHMHANSATKMNVADDDI